jgi:hypothetical protein
MKIISFITDHLEIVEQVIAEAKGKKGFTPKDS